ncbi:NAD(P)/FAD-dependent oxidoreductase [Streptomyces sp. MJM8645]|uniref:phytoene desaturase family protein n=1 Tax=Streptomyces sp. MJM8645 TaxID=1120523 RepID=UPI0007AFBF0B|nr:NAD(P)/FAD-dependent oxidoreductase [Streptomyces sp. MJM8645]
MKWNSDVAVVGSGPNGLAAAVTFARAGLHVDVYESQDEIGGGLRTHALFDSDVRHDICSAVHPMAAVSPFFRRFDLSARGIDLLQAEASYAHPLADGRAAVAYHDLDRTCDALGRDGAGWRRLMAPLIGRSTEIGELFLSDFRSVPASLRTPAMLAWRSLVHGTALATRRFATDEAAALLAGVAAHAVGRLPSIVGGAVSVFLGHLAHSSGWPVPRGGSSEIAAGLAEDIRRHGGLIHTGARITELAQVRGSRVVMFDTGPKEFSAVAGDRLPAAYRRRLGRFRYGPAAAKVDFLVSEAIPWRNTDVARAATVHLGGSQAQIYRRESGVARGVDAGDPFVLLVDPGVADPDRVHAGKRPVWAYAHVPNGYAADPTGSVTAQIEKYAPGFSETVLAARSTNGVQYEAYNPNYVGGDIGAGALTLGQLLMRPTLRWNPYATPLPGVYLCSASTPPGPGVHGMSGYLAAVSALRREFGIAAPPSLGPRPASLRREP